MRHIHPLQERKSCLDSNDFGFICAGVSNMVSYKTNIWVVCHKLPAIWASSKICFVERVFRDLWCNQQWQWLKEECRKPMLGVWDYARQNWQHSDSDSMSWTPPTDSCSTTVSEDKRSTVTVPSETNSSSAFQLILSTLSLNWNQHPWKHSAVLSSTVWAAEHKTPPPTPFPCTVPVQITS